MFFFKALIKWLTDSTVNPCHDQLVIWIFLTIIELVWELIISSMQNKFQHNTWKTLQVIAPANAITDNAEIQLQ